MAIQLTDEQLRLERQLRDDALSQYDLTPTERDLLGEFLHGVRADFQEAMERALIQGNGTGAMIGIPETLRPRTDPGFEAFEILRPHLLSDPRFMFEPNRLDGFEI
ncbi:hypothetical protein ACIOUE_00965 [Streptomyces xanthochromogenes]|uniref:hypothetical protein n=1 Tax=Streptomyces xanthochromogenes TaxID=67384 RepID=UPI00382EC741